MDLRGHSTETTQLRVWSDMLIAINKRRLALLCMIDMSEAFDCVDHSIMLRRLQVGVGITGVVLDWITSFLTDRTQQVAYNSHLSVMQTVLFGGPQGSVIGPLLYVLYTAELSKVIMRRGLNVRQYIDDTQLYLYLYLTHLWPSNVWTHASSTLKPGLEPAA